VHNQVYGADRPLGSPSLAPAQHTSSTLITTLARCELQRRGSERAALS
jgi:hypothetical protein